MGTSHESSGDFFGTIRFHSFQALSILDEILPMDAELRALERRSRMPNLTTTADHSVVVDIGGIPIRLLTDDVSFLHVVQDRYHGFLSSDHHAAVDLAVELVPPGRISDQEDIRVVREAGRWLVERQDFRFVWDPQSGVARIRQFANPYSLDGVFRIMHTLFLASQGGFLLHAASAVRNGRAFLFFGPSGAGKSTIARFAPPDTTLLSDEISYVRNEQLGYSAHGTPFTGELGQPGANTSAPIAGLYYLVQAPRNHLTAMKPVDAVRALLESVLFFAEDPELVTLVFQSACDIVSRLPVYKLEFKRDQSVWDILE
jgi:hypothetical protein